MCHESISLHKTSVERMEEFQRRAHLTEKPDVIRSKIEKTRQHQIQLNRAALLSIIDTVLTCARQNLSLRSHRGESAALLSESEEPETNDDNVRSLLRYRMRRGDVALATHLKQGPSNGKYLSSRIQNEILDIALKLVRKKVLLRIQKAECWTLIVDETLDVRAYNAESSWSSQFDIFHRMMEHCDKLKIQ